MYDSGFVGGAFGRYEITEEIGRGAMKAKSKPLVTKSPGDYGVDVAPRLETLKVTEPAKRQAGIKVGSVDDLVAKLKDM